MKSYRQSLFAAQQYPAPKEVFELTVRTPLSARDMLDGSRFKIPLERLLFKGEVEILPPQTRRFKLVPLGFQRRFSTIRQHSAGYGRIPEVQWLRALTDKFPFSRSMGRIGIARLAWGAPGFTDLFPCISDQGVEDFDEASDCHCCTFDPSWLWLVEEMTS